MKTIARIGLAALASVSGLASASAADVMAPMAPAVVVVPMVPPAPGLLLAGNIDVWGGWRFVTSTQDPNGNHFAYGANAAISVPFGANFSIQLKAAAMIGGGGAAMA